MNSWINGIFGQSLGQAGLQNQQNQANTSQNQYQLLQALFGSAIGGSISGLGTFLPPSRFVPMRGSLLYFSETATYEILRYK